SFSARDHKVNVTSLICGDGTTTRNLFRYNQDDLEFELNGFSVSKSNCVAYTSQEYISIQMRLISCVISGTNYFILGPSGEGETFNEILIDSCEINTTNRFYGRYHNIKIFNSVMKDIGTFF